MEQVSGQTIVGQVLSMDGKHFIDCEIRNCILEYSGQALIMETTLFSQCSFRFTGEAALTMRFLECFGITERPGEGDMVLPSILSVAQRPN